MTGDVEPAVTVRGPGEPEVAIVGGVHGDEPSGVRAIEQVLAADPDLRRGVAFVEANPPALAAGERYLDADLNRSFPGDEAAAARERRLAARVLDAVEGCDVLSLHSTHSTPQPMALLSRRQPRALELAAGLPVEHVIDETDAIDGALTEHAPAVTLEAGCQGTDAAAETAERFVYAFLRLTGALPGDPEDVDRTYYRLDEPVEKPPDAPDEVACSELFDLRVDNFERVEAGTAWATADGEPYVAEEPFVPVLMSECGYDGILGYRASVLADTLAGARRALAAD